MGGDHHLPAPRDQDGGRPLLLALPLSVTFHRHKLIRIAKQYYERVIICLCAAKKQETYRQGPLKAVLHPELHVTVGL